LVHEEGLAEVYGWVELDQELERDMKLFCEGPEHFDFSWNTNPAKHLQDFVRQRIREFAKEIKIIDSEEARKNRIQKAAEEKALRSLSSLFKKLDLFGKHLGRERERKPFHRRKDEPLRLSISDIQYPRENRRVNWGEEIKNTYVVPINEALDSLLVLVRVFVVSNDGKTYMSEEREVPLHRGKGPKVGSDLIAVSNKFPKGEYALKAKMISLEDAGVHLPDGTKIEKGTKLYERINQKFYVEMDPPEHGPFRFEPKEEKEDKTCLFEWESEGDGYIIRYNKFHPKIKGFLHDEEELGIFLTEYGALIAYQIKLEELVADSDTSKEFSKQMFSSGNPSVVMPELFQKYSEFMWDYYLEKPDGN